MRHIDTTPHFEHETLFWVRAAAVLGLPQVRMADSRLPFAADEARASLQALLLDNIGPGYIVPSSDERLAFEGWHDLCRHYAPVFVEKSPHHLHQWSAIELLLESTARVPGVDVLFVGLIRNPMDTLYSMWQRWRGLPGHNERDWRIAYTNLLRLRDLAGGRLVILRYEDMVRDTARLDPIYRFIGAPSEPSGYLHDKSVGKWRNDPRFRFRLAPSTVALAEQFGYDRGEMENRGSSFWPLYAAASRWYVRRVQPFARSRARS